MIYHPEADAEVIEAAEFYLSEQSALAIDFLDTLDAAIVSVLADPFRLPVVEDNIRRYTINRFPYSIYFKAEGDTLCVLAVAHHSRDPDYWRHRK